MPTRTPASTYWNGNVGNRQSGRRAHNRERVRILLRIGREHHRDDLRLVQEAFGEQRPDRAVDQAAGENLFFGGTSLALDKAARNLSGGVGVFAIIHGQREKRRARLGILGHTSGDQDHRVTGSNDNRAVRLFGHLARFDGDGAASQVYFNCMQH